MSRQRLGIFPASFNPPTKAHAALIQAAANRVDRVLAVLPRKFPHKAYDGVTLDQRVTMLEAMRAEIDFGIHLTAEGLFIDIARECRAAFGPGVDLWFICGRDAAERIVTWDYGRADAIRDMLQEFGLLVAARDGEYVPPPELAHRVERLDVPAEIAAISATNIRTRIERGDPWQDLVPRTTIPLITRFYGPPPVRSS